jgi:hypothetical protein
MQLPGGAVFGGAISSGSDSYVNYLLPGILLMVANLISLVVVVGVALLMGFRSNCLSRHPEARLMRPMDTTEG